MGAFTEYLPYELKRFRLAPQFIAIVGEQGSGKSSLATAMICDDYRCHRAERLAMARSLSEAYSAANRVDLTATLPEHVYFSSYPVLLDPKAGVYTHFLDIARIGLPDGVSDVQYFPRGSVLVIDEAQMKIYCRAWQKTPENFLHFFEVFRHLDLTIIFITQIFDKLDKGVRDLVTNRFLIDGLRVRHVFWRFGTRIEWRFTDQKAQHVTANPGQDARRFEHKRSFTFKGDVFARYENQSCAPLFLYGITRLDPRGGWTGGYAVEEHRCATLERDSISAFAASLPQKSGDSKAPGSKKGGSAAPQP